MYAAAGGASLASRQARQRQRQQKKTQQLQAKLHPPKASVLSVAEHGASTPTRQSRQFHQLPTNYLRTPQMQARKLSASYYTGQSRLLLPIDEGDTQSVLHMRMHSHVHHAASAAHHSHSHGAAAGTATPGGHYVTTAAQQHHHQHHQHHHHHHHHHGRVSPKFGHRLSSSSATSFRHSHLPKSATATLPLVSQVEATPPTTPSGAVAVKTSAAAIIATPTTADATVATAVGADVIAVPVVLQADAIIVTPATPMASPGHVAKSTIRDKPLRDEVAADEEKQPLTSGIGDDVDVYEDDESLPPPPPGPLERKCSVYRMRRSDASQLKELQFNQQQQYEPLVIDEPPQIMFKGLPNGRKWQPCAYCEEGICVCEHIECAQGRAAWLERGRRCSVLESQERAAACHRRWVKRNRIQDASLGGSSDDEDFLGVLRGPSTFANAFLYVGLGTIALGLVIAFVGTGEKGFKTVELRLIGPSLIVLGLTCCILRILFCICPSHCISSSKKTRKKNGNKVDADHTTSLLRGESKRVSIARAPSMQPKYPATHKRSQSKMLNEGMEALRQIATTSLFMQNEQKPSLNRVVPIIQEPESLAGAPLELKKLETAPHVSNLADDRTNRPERTDKAGKGDKAPTAGAHATNANGAKKSDNEIVGGTIKTKTATTAVTATTTTSSDTIQSTVTTTKKATISKESPAASNTASKHARTRVALNQQQQQQKPQQQQQQQQQKQKPPLEKSTQLQESKSQSLSSSSTVKGSIGDESLLMETSLMVLKPAITTTSESRPPLAGNVCSTATGATSRLTGTPTSTATATTASVLPPPPTYTGAIPRLPTTSQSSYDLPPATPHSYAAAAASYRASTGTDRTESLIRGPLGMPLSALTASSSAYAFPATPPHAAGASAAAATSMTSSKSSIPLGSISSHLPGQVMETSKSPAIISSKANASTPASSGTLINPIRLSSPQMSLSKGGYTSILGTSSSSSRQSSSATGSSYKFPMPLSTTSSLANTSMSAALLHGRSVGTASGAGALSTVRPTSASGIAVAPSIGSSLVPPATPPVNKFEPELLLSPAKLGQ